MLGKAGMDSPTNTPREDSPASGPSPEVQVPGKSVSVGEWCKANGMVLEIGCACGGSLCGSPEPFPADDEQDEGAA